MVNVERFRENRSELPPAIYEGVGWVMAPGYVGVEYEEIDGLLVGFGPPGRILIGSFTKRTVEDRLRSTPYERYASADGVTYYRWDASSSSPFVGVADGSLVAGGSGGDTPAKRFGEQVTALF
jgi:hypothetical protein